MAFWEGLENPGISQARKMRFPPSPSSSFKEAFSKCSGFITLLLMGVINFQISKEMDSTFFFNEARSHKAILRQAYSVL